MRYSKTIMAIAAAAILMAGCGSSAENDSKATTTTAAAETSAAETEPATTADADTDASETEISTDDEDPFSDSWETPEQLIPVTYEGDFEYNGVTFKTMGDVIAVAGDDPNVACFGNQFICVVENDDICARFIANMPSDLLQQFYDLDVFADDYKEKELELGKDLEIARFDDMKVGILSQDELDKFVGGAVSNFEGAGFELNGWTIADTEGEFTYANGNYEYTVVFNEPLSEGTDYYEGGARDGFTIKSVTYSQLSPNVFNTDDLLE